MSDMVVFDGESNLIISKCSDMQLIHAGSGEFGVFTTKEKQIPIYNGNTEVEPLLKNDVILNTANKKVIQDITVKKIPIVYTSNVYDGKTVVIG